MVPIRVGVVVEGVCLLVVLIGRPGRHGTGLVGKLNEILAAVKQDFGPPAEQCGSQAPASHFFSIPSGYTPASLCLCSSHGFVLVACTAECSLAPSSKYPPSPPSRRKEARAVSPVNPGMASPRWASPMADMFLTPPNASFQTQV